MGWFRRLWRRLLGWLRSRGVPAVDAARIPELPSKAQDRYEVIHLSEDPDELLPWTLYAIGENGTLWHVALVCPCGCGASIALNLLPDDSPRWTLSEHAEGPTLSPSVWRTAGCRSHFFLRRGQVSWCGPHDSEQGS